MVVDIFYIILALLGIGVLIFVHEMGHYLMARRVGMRVEVFSIGFGPAIYSWERNGVKWKLSILPFGGYVRFAGTEKEGNKEPHEIEDGYFGKKPIDRIKVAFMGPFVNFIFALLVFTVIWLFGGREKPFFENTHFIGFVDPKSKLYAKNVKPGDELLRYDGKKFDGAKTLLYFGVVDNGHSSIQGYKIDYYNDEKTPFDYDLKTYPNPMIENLTTVGILTTARYLIYDKLPKGIENPFIDGSPMQKVGLQYKDRILWANGELIFSREQLNHITNDNTAFLTIKRDGKIFHTTIERVKIEDLQISSYDYEEIEDWKHDAKIAGKIKDLKVLPFYFNDNCVIETPFSFVDEQLEERTFSKKRLAFFTPFERGDRIIAIDGVKVDKAMDLLKLLQKKHVTIIVQRDPSIMEITNWRVANKEFTNLPMQDLKAIVQTIGQEIPLRDSGNLHLLNSAEPKTMQEMEIPEKKKQELVQEFASYEKKIEKIDDPEKKQIALNLLEKNKNRKILGIPFLKDKTVRYNPNPLISFYQSFTEIWKTLIALVSGSLSPKFLVGPVGIVQTIQMSWSIGWREALFWLSVISINLGLINLLPLPALDGGHILFSVIEMVTKKPLKVKTMEKLILPFFILLIAVFVFFTYQDIIRIISRFFG